MCGLCKENVTVQCTHDNIAPLDTLIKRRHGIPESGELQTCLWIMEDLKKKDVTSMSSSAIDYSRPTEPEGCSHSPTDLLLK